MSAENFSDGVEEALADPLLGSELAELVPGQWSVLIGNRPVSSIPVSQLPCFVLEQGSGAAEPIGDDGQFLTIGNHSQSFRSLLSIAAIWNDNDRKRAARLRSALPRLLAQLFLRYPQPGGVVSAWLDGWDTDAGTRHPSQVWIGTVAGQYVIDNNG